MKLNFAIICDNAFTDQKDRLTIIQSLDTIFTPGFPAIHPRLTLVTSFRKEKEKKGKEYIQNITIKHRISGKTIANLESKNKLKKGTSNIQFIAYFIGLKLDDEGFYDINIKLDNEEVASPSFQVKKASA